MRRSLGTLALLAPLAAQALEVRLPDGTPLSVEVDAAASDSLILWLPSGFGRQPAEARVARELAAAGVERCGARSCSRRGSCRRSKAAWSRCRTRTRRR